MIHTPSLSASITNVPELPEISNVMLSPPRIRPVSSEGVSSDAENIRTVQGPITNQTRSGNSRYCMITVRFTPLC